MTTKPRSRDRHAWISKLRHWRHPMQAVEMDTEQTNDCAGIWVDVSDEDFRAFLSDIEERRRAAFTRRPAR